MSDTHWRKFDSGVEVVESPFCDGAHWNGKPWQQMSKDDLLWALADKIHELRLCYAVMTADQARHVARQLSGEEYL